MPRVYPLKSKTYNVDNEECEESGGTLTTQDYSDVADDGDIEIVCQGVTSVYFMSTGYIADGSTNTSTTDSVPTMTSKTAPSGEVIYSSKHGSSTEQAPFDDNFGSGLGWASNGGVPQWVGYDFEANGGPGAKCINKFSITNREVAGLGPANFNFEAWDGAAWITLGSWSGESWGTLEKRWFNVSNENEYTKYRVYVTQNTSGTNCQIVEIEFVEAESSGVPAWTIQDPDPTSTYSKSTPTGSGEKTVTITNKSGSVKDIRVEYFA